MCRIKFNFIRNIHDFENFRFLFADWLVSKGLKYVKKEIEGVWVKTWKKEKYGKLNLILYGQIIHNFENFKYYLMIRLKYIILDWKKNKKEVMQVYFPKNKVHKIKCKILTYPES